MKNRLQQFLSAENITQSEFADTIQVAKASVSHILSGRNNPGYDFLESMARHYPNLNLEWFISGRGKMYKTPFNAENAVQADEKEANTEVSNSNTTSIDAVQQADKERTISKILIFYSDGSFQEII